MFETGALAAEILGVSSEAAAIRDFAEKAGRSAAPVMLLGEPGTGKQLVAQSIHELSPRSKAPFLMIDCSLYYERELKRELFGYGGLEGVTKPSRKGLLEFASPGSCYLSHIEELTPSIQSAILRFLEAGRVPRLGDGKEVSSGARLVVSSDKNLEGFVRSGLFDATLYRKLSKLKKRLPPLRERGEDIPVILESMRTAFAGRSGEGLPAEFCPEALLALRSYPWPLNFDELKKELARLLEGGNRRIGAENLSMEIASYWLGQRGDPQVRKVIEELDGYIREFRILSRLNHELGDIADVLATAAGEADGYRDLDL